MHWKGKKVTVMGLGLLGGGVGTARYAVAHGAKVTVTDLRTAEELASSIAGLDDLSVRYILGRHEEDDFRRAHLVIRNPGIPLSSPFLVLAKKAHVAVETEASIFTTATEAFVIGVTGTKGKTTTAHLIAEGFRAMGISVELTGVPGTSFLGTLHAIESLKEQPVVVAEYSSWDLESMHSHRISPPVAVMTSFFPDHLNRHKTMEAYFAAKTAVYTYQRDEDVVIVPDGLIWSAGVCKNAPAQCARVFPADAQKLPRILLIGTHQRINAALAWRAIAQAIAHPAFPGGFQPTRTERERALAAIAAFRGVPGRLEQIGESRGRRFINDTAATNPGATQAAIAALRGRPLILIAGGEDKDLPFDALAEDIARHVKYLVLLKGSASERLRMFLEQNGFSVISTGHAAMESAVSAAWQASASGDTILLSPAAASFNLFHNEFERGDAFTRAVEAISKTS